MHPRMLKTLKMLMSKNTFIDINKLWRSFKKDENPSPARPKRNDHLRN